MLLVEAGEFNPQSWLKFWGEIRDLVLEVGSLGGRICMGAWGKQLGHLAVEG
ncbi:MAG: hypothetical protein QNJ36_04700 [Calothrix sp. MO_167.B42]|nr:hypothetical protein [Calothrix sp. MO_167.B42]